MDSPTRSPRALGTAPTRPTRRFLFDFEPRVHITLKETAPLLLLGKMPYFVKFDQSVANGDRLFDFRGAPGPAQRSFAISVMADPGTLQHGSGLLFSDTGRAEQKGEFATTSHGQDGMEQLGGGKNVHHGKAKVRLYVLVDGVGDDARMTDGINARLVDPGVQRRHVDIQNGLVDATKEWRDTAPLRPPKKASLGSRGGTNSRVDRNACTCSEVVTSWSHSHSHISITRYPSVRRVWVLT